MRNKQSFKCVLAKHFLRTLLAAAVFLPAISVRAEIPNLINYQSRLRTRAGAAVTAPTVVRFSLYASQTQGVHTDKPGAQGPLLWSEWYNGSSQDCAKIQPDEEGYFSVQLGACNAFPDYLSFTEPLYLGVTIEQDQEAVPRAFLTSFPYASNARTVGGFKATSTPASGHLLALDSHLNFNIKAGTYGGAAMQLASTTAYSSILGHLGIGTTTPEAVLTIQGSGSADILSVLSHTGTPALTVSGEGRIGIGTTTPGALLAVAGNIEVAGTTTLTGVTYTWPALQGSAGQVLTNNGSGALSWTTISTGSGSLSSDGLWAAGSGVIYAATTTADKVGIGTSAPSEKLTVSGNVLITNDSLPKHISYNDSNITNPNSVYVKGKYAYVANESNNLVSIQDVSSPGYPASKGIISTNIAQARQVVVAGKYAYVINKSTYGLSIHDVSSPSGVVAKGYITTNINLPYQLYVSGKYAYVVSSSGLAVFDVSNPSSIVAKGVTTANLSDPRGLWVSGKYAYVASYGNNTLAIFDVSNPDSITALGAITTNLTGPLSVYVTGPYAFVASSGNNRLAVFDVSNPSSIVAKTYISTGLTVPRHVTVSGMYAYVSSAAGVSVFDISSLPFAPVSKGTITSNISSATWAHVSGKYLYVTSANNNYLNIFEINGLASPAVQTGAVQSSAANITENVEVGNSLYVWNGANIGSGGLMVEGNASIQGGVAVGGPAVSGAVASFTNSSGTCSINPTTSSLSCASDGRLKKDVSAIGSALDKVLSLQGVMYRWLNEGATSTVHLGFIAQDLEKVVPEVVSTDDSGYKSVAYSSLIPLLAEAIKEQQLQIAGFKAGAVVQGSSVGNLSVDVLAVSRAAVFEGELAVKGHLYLSTDSAGQARVLSGATSVRVAFATSYEYQPIVTVTPRGLAALSSEFKYTVTDENSEGFTIQISRPVTTDLEFSWHAFAAPEARLTVSDGTLEDVVLIMPQFSAPVAGGAGENADSSDGVAGEIITRPEPETPGQEDGEESPAEKKPEDQGQGQESDRDKGNYENGSGKQFGEQTEQPQEPEAALEPETPSAESK